MAFLKLIGCRCAWRPGSGGVLVMLRILRFHIAFTIVVIFALAVLVGCGGDSATEAPDASAPQATQA